MTDPKLWGKILTLLPTGGISARHCVQYVKCSGERLIWYMQDMVVTHERTVIMQSDRVGRREKERERTEKKQPLYDVLKSSLLRANCTPGPLNTSVAVLHVPVS